MSTFRLFGRAAFGRPWFGTVTVPDGTSASEARNIAYSAACHDPAQPDLLGMRVDAPGSPWLNAGQVRGREAVEIVAAILGAAVVRRPGWLLSCPQDGAQRPFGAPDDAAMLPLPIASAGRVAAHRRHAAEVGARWARVAAPIPAMVPAPPPQRVPVVREAGCRYCERYRLPCGRHEDLTWGA